MIEKTKQIKQLPGTDFGYTNLDGASKLTGLSKSLLYKLCSRRKLPHYKPSGGRLIFKIAELKDWIEQSALSVID